MFPVGHTLKPTGLAGFDGPFAVCNPPNNNNKSPCGTGLTGPTLTDRHPFGSGRQVLAFINPASSGLTAAASDRPWGLFGVVPQPAARRGCQGVVERKPQSTLCIAKPPPRWEDWGPGTGRIGGVAGGLLGDLETVCPYLFFRPYVEITASLSIPVFASISNFLFYFIFFGLFFHTQNRALLHFG